MCFERDMLYDKVKTVQISDLTMKLDDFFKDW